MERRNRRRQLTRQEVEAPSLPVKRDQLHWHAKDFPSPDALTAALSLNSQLGVTPGAGHAH
eukprot:CAMPEP_0181215732 /NCGR_PEP_ID=MMETSP1096-20121128/26176_1 /TAXON_ID=156174 ORGANISM="Chrysochromulina ericina, Strain CCMP281" /NCGR_SAMPLE_ID=MMETSP1096 /ASSEMBLY_ACC=CAM_ASM_000453 /LENGTH=60 /DNA_ID=CAMNT_0023307619 /DNA_START=330 /DNA_END=512 /DNA_ORIENTATION=+